MVAGSEGDREGADRAKPNDPLPDAGYLIATILSTTPGPHSFSWFL